MSQCACACFKTVTTADNGQIGLYLREDRSHYILVTHRISRTQCAIDVQCTMALDATLGGLHASLANLIKFRFAN